MVVIRTILTLPTWQRGSQSCWRAARGWSMSPASPTWCTAELSERASADSRFGDLYDVMEEISLAIEQSVADPALRGHLQRLTTRFVAYVAMINLVIYRRGGAGLLDVMRKLWSWRRLIGQCTLVDFATTLRLRSLGRILLPTPLVRWSLMLRLDRLF